MSGMQWVGLIVALVAGGFFLYRKNFRYNGVLEFFLAVVFVGALLVTFVPETARQIFQIFIPVPKKHVTGITSSE